MGIDVSKVRLNPFLDFAGVELKQGGVLIDADVNELTGIVDRRLRALASDILGRARVSSTTADAFKLSVSGATLNIGKGRLYVDGLLAENHGAETTDKSKFLLDPLLADPQFNDAIGYAAQSYLPLPPALPTAGRHLVYLDVWNREVTHLEAPDLVEPAVGVEATGRIQTVWQVRAHAPDSGTATTCATPDINVPGWSELIAPSTGRLTVGEHEVAPVDDPCELPPTGGYRGLENQLYRVEIHAGGAPGTATFKWSRDNASVGGRVASIVSATVLELESLGRDDVLSFKTGDWVEITDDAREFSQAPGEMRKITVDTATRRITFTGALPATLLPSPNNFPNAPFPKFRNMRVRRWDQGGKVFRTNGNNPPLEVPDPALANGVITVPLFTVTLLLEHGITVNFASTTGAKGFRPGDYWVFAARTSDASVEKLIHAAPRGVHHHYARLGIWDVAAGTVTDCRTPWPPAAGEGHDCSCTACVTQVSHADGSFTIQAAVNQASQTGGTVCIGPGQYALAEPVKLVNSRALRIRGQGAATILVAAAGAFALQNCFSVAIENLAIIAQGTKPAISVNSALGLKLRELMIAMINNTDNRRSSAISLRGVVAATVIEDNGVFADLGITAIDPSSLTNEESAGNQFLLAGALAIMDNIFWSTGRAISLEGRVMHIADTRITGNDVFASKDIAISLLGLGIASSTTKIMQNNLYVEGNGIAAALDGLWIGENKIVNSLADDKATAIALSPGFGKTGIGPCQILANQIQGFADAGIVIENSVRNLIIKLNIIEDCGNGIITRGAPVIESASIENNQLRNIGANANQPDVMSIGIGVTRAKTVAIVGNTIRRLGVDAVRSTLRAGVLAFGVERTRIADNDIIEIGPNGGFVGPAIGILLISPLADYRVEQNRVERDANVNQEGETGPFSALHVADGDEEKPVAVFGIFASANVIKAPRVMFSGNKAFTATIGEIVSAGTSLCASITGNTLISRGQLPAVEALAAELQFSNNRVEAFQNRRVAVHLRTPLLIMSANRVVGGERTVYIKGATMKGVTVVGNITSGAITLSDDPLDKPWNELNIIA